MVNEDIIGKEPTQSVEAYGVWCGTGRHIKNKNTACAYAFTVPELTGEEVFWGRGGEKDTQVMLAHMIPHVVNVVAQNSSDVGITFIVRTTGTDRYFTHHIWPWLAEEAKGEPVDHDRYDVWKSALQHKIVGALQLQKASGKKATSRIAPLLKEAMRQAEEAGKAKEHVHLGVTCTSEGPA